ncbi:MAG TPA: hypothetical protein VEN79_07755 [Terriglobia bacterium]|nr:hypothetical protein [Terriglobia bacterium]
MAFTPKLDTLPASQRRLWAELGGTPETFTLYGGTALVVRFGHRTYVASLLDIAGTKAAAVQERAEAKGYLDKDVTP